MKVSYIINLAIYQAFVLLNLVMRTLNMILQLTHKLGNRLFLTYQIFIHTFLKFIVHFLVSCVIVLYSFYHVFEFLDNIKFLKKHFYFLIEIFLCVAIVLFNLILERLSSIFQFCHSLFKFLNEFNVFFHSFDNSVQIFNFLFNVFCLILICCKFSGKVSCSCAEFSQQLFENTSR